MKPNPMFKVIAAAMWARRFTAPGIPTEVRREAERELTDHLATRVALDMDEAIMSDALAPPAYTREWLRGSIHALEIFAEEMTKRATRAFMANEDEKANVYRTVVWEAERDIAAYEDDLGDLKEQG